MAVVQASFGDPARQKAPGVVDNGETHSIFTRPLDGAGAFFGRALFRTAGSKIVTATPAAGAFIGISVASEGEATFPSFAYPGDGSGVINDVYEPYESCPILSKGLIWILAGANVTAGAQAYVTSGGAFTGSSSGNLLIPARFEDAASASGLTRLRVG